MNNAETAQGVTQSEAAQTLLRNLHETLNEEKWTRASLGNYSTNQFKDLDAILKTARQEKVLDELKKTCDEHLSHTRNSLIALYLSGMIALSRQIIDDSAMINLVSIFLDNHKWGIVKYLCERILDYGESKYALRTLADCHKQDNEENKIYEVWERLVKVDFEEADIAKSLAEHYEKQKKTEDAIDYYKKALHRFINKGNFANVKEIWEKLLDIDIEDIDFFLHIQKKIAKSISEDKAVVLLNELYAKYKQKDIDISINILKIALEYDEKDVHGRREIIECFRKKYASHSQLEEYIRISNLSQNYRSVYQAIADFEKHIAFDNRNFVYHRTWGVGRIASIAGDEIKIDFSKKRGHTMALKMAVDALQTLSKDHIWVLKATKKKEELREMILKEKEKNSNDNIVLTLKTIIRSFGNACDMKRIKAEISPALLTAGEWSTWNSKAREILKSNPDFGISPENSDIYMVRERPVSVTEKLYNEFSAAKGFYDKVSAIRDYVDNKKADPDSEYFTEMFSFFTSFLRPATNEPRRTTEYSAQNAEYAVSTFLLIAELSQNKNYAHLKSSLTVSFSDVFSNIKDIPAMFKNLKDGKLKTEFLHNVKNYLGNWADIYVKLFPYSQLPSIPEQVEEAGFADKLTSLCIDCFEKHRDNREAVVWFYKNAREKSWFKAANIGEEKQLITLIHIMDYTFRDIENSKDTVENRKINKQVYNILFKDGDLTSFIENADEDTIIRLFTFVNDVKDLDPQDKLNLRSCILDKYPNFKFLEKAEKKVSRGLMITGAMFEEIKRRLVHIMEVEVPANSKEIEYALSLGDLRENAEFKAAKEKQTELNSQIARLQEDIDRARLFDPNSINSSKVSFGTKVVLFNETTSQKEEFTILGPWESDSNNHIISYLSPFGNAILNRTVGEKFEFSINDEQNSYLVEDISLAAI
ncbi:MAG: transcription elongation factor GreA [Treponema sp.]|nr:transcription elongation factor GreA [Treponema sp.]MCL2236744.1 transcription elongation factor GreA [Treponema sp.]